MSRLIDADKLAERIRRAAMTDDLTTTMARELAERWIEDAPSVEAQHRWPSAWVEDPYGYCHCKRCGWMWDEAEQFSTYCPACGSKMTEYITQDRDGIELTRVPIEEMIRQ